MYLFPTIICYALCARCWAATRGRAWRAGSSWSSPADASPRSSSSGWMRTCAYEWTVWRASQELTSRVRVPLPTVRSSLTAHGIEDYTRHLRPAGVLLHRHKFWHHLMRGAMTGEVTGLGERSDWRAQYRFLDAFQHGSVVDEAAAALNIQRR